MIGKVRNIIIIESLTGERQTGLEIYNDCIKRKIDFGNKDFIHRYHSVNSKEELVELLKYYIHNADYFPGGILLHFEMHGDSAKRGLVLSNGNLVEWEELIDLFREINLKTKNNLFITMATCFGRYLYKGVDPYKKSPYSGYISASTAIYPDEIIEKYITLFDYLIDNGNIIDAYLEMEKQGSNFYYKDSLTTFEEAFQITLKSLYGDENLKKEILNNVQEQALKEKGYIYTDKEKNVIFQKALEDIYNAQKSAFEF